jgi:hypothetical protein
MHFNIIFSLYRSEWFSTFWLILGLQKHLNLKKFVRELFKKVLKSNVYCRLHLKLEITIQALVTCTIMTQTKNTRILTVTVTWFFKFKYLT